MSWFAFAVTSGFVLSSIHSAASWSTASRARIVQRRLLKLVEGATLGVGFRDHTKPASVRTIDTSGILILAGGAFAGIDDPKIRSKRPQGLQREMSTLGFNAVVSADLVTYGFMPELVARLPVLIEYQALQERDLLEILDNETVSPAQVWTNHFRHLGKSLTLTSEAKTYVARSAMLLGMGARGLHQVLFPPLARLTYDLENLETSLIALSEVDLRPTRLSPNKESEHA